MKVKKRKFKKPATGLRAQGPVSNIGYAGVRVHQGGVYDSLRHTQLTCTLISPPDKELIEGTLKTIITGPQAVTLPDGKNGWSVVELAAASFNTMGQCRAYLVMYKGMEVALYFKRQLTEIKLQSGDRYPEGVLQDPSEAWQRLDLLGKSAKQSNVVLINIQARLEQENSILKERVQTLETLNGKLETAEHKTAEIMQYLTESEKTAIRKRKRKGDKLGAKKHKKEIQLKHKRIEAMREAKRKSRRRKNRSKK